MKSHRATLWWWGALLIVSSALLTGCLDSVWTGATLFYDRHNVYKKASDFQLAANASHALYKDEEFKRLDCSIDLAVFNGDILLAGQVPTVDLRKEAQTRIAALPNTRRIFNQLSVGTTTINTLKDNWITAKIRSAILADSDIDPHDFKVVTSFQIVYLMGDVIPSQADRVIRIASGCVGVKRVVKLLKYYNLSNQAREN